MAGADEWYPLTQSLLERAHRIDRSCLVPDRAMVERTIRQIADASNWTKPPIIKWLDTPSEAFDHLSRLGLDALLDMGTTTFWRRFQPPAPSDVMTFDRAFEVRTVANELLGVDEHYRILMAPKLRAKAQAISANASGEEVYRVRAVSSQIGWLETSMADAAAQAVSNVELLLSAGASEGSVAIDHQLKVFDAHECGLLATWEASDALICVPSTFEPSPVDPGHFIRWPPGLPLSVSRCPFIGPEQKSRGSAATSEFDPNRSFGGIALDTEFYLDEYLSGLKRK